MGYKGGTEIEGVRGVSSILASMRVSIINKPLSSVILCDAFEWDFDI